MTVHSLRALLFGALAATGPLATVAALLKEKTHHRQLGAVTFALVAAVVVVVAVVAARRSLSPSSPRWIVATVSTMAILSAAVAALFAVSSSG